MSKPSRWFVTTGSGETIFQNWLASLFRGQHWHVQEFEDRRRIGIPDLSAANNGQDAWLELKMTKRVHSVHDYLHLDHGVTAQQHRWLLDRSLKSKAVCGVVVAWRTGPEAEPQEYITFVPIDRWRVMLNKEKTMAWVLSPFTARVDWLLSNRLATMARLLNGGFKPGWGGDVVRGTPIVIPGVAQF